ncbi:hypothetical protein CMV_013915 [Castanea mollissima]|uniref:Alpha/beta hydrolase n=1 Tax=Castanea mollissima TaxID=60419 RepID=A0A8J4VHP3_9ROSI|nr:hypothetical protein CMV_013915 [Castanea mollissima]
MFRLTTNLTSDRWNGYSKSKSKPKKRTCDFCDSSYSLIQSWGSQVGEFIGQVWNFGGRKGEAAKALLFTAANSDDISTAIQFINKARPWITLMAVGWEYGANMLTKYLAKAGENTPLTAAMCIDNPFDLEEATRSFPYHMAIGQKFTSGLIDILRSNKNWD